MGHAYLPGWDGFGVLQGGIRELRLYGHALSDAAMASVYNEVVDKWAPAADAIGALPMPMLLFDARNLTGSRTSGTAVSRWYSNGAAMLDMTAVNVGTGTITLQYDGGHPHVQFDRVGVASSYLVSSGPLPLPSDASRPGVTVAMVIRMPLGTVGNYEGLLMCGDSDSSSIFFITRNVASTNLMLQYRSSGQPLVAFPTTSAVINGQWQTVIIRMSATQQGDHAILTADGLTQIPRRNDTSSPAVLALPKTMVRIWPNPCSRNFMPPVATNAAISNVHHAIGAHNTPSAPNNIRVLGCFLCRRHVQSAHHIGLTMLPCQRLPGGSASCVYTARH